MEIQFRPYAMAIQLVDTVASGVTLKDSGGTALKCNYISVEASGANPDAFFQVALDPGDDSTKLTTPLGSTLSANNSLGIDTSGCVGGYASVNKGVVEYLLSDVDRASVVRISLDEDGVTNFWITYGQIQAGNRLRDNLRPVGS